MVADGCRRLVSEVPLPWTKDNGVTDEELRCAVREENLELLTWMHDVTVGMGWCRGPRAELQTIADGSWFRFLVCAHHTATARGIPAGKRMACLVVRGQGGKYRREEPFTTARCGIKSDQWAGRMLARRHRDPALAAMRMMPGRDED